jgi:hypothetical protein
VDRPTRRLRRARSDYTLSCASPARAIEAGATAKSAASVIRRQIFFANIIKERYYITIFKLFEVQS